jgi:hypothetical protein
MEASKRDSIALSFSFFLFFGLLLLCLLACLFLFLGKERLWFPG